MSATPNDIRAGKAVVELSVKDKLKGGLQGALSQVKGFQAAIAVAGAAVAASFGARAVGSIYDMAKTFSVVGDDIAKMAKRTGLAVEAISELRFAAGQSGTEIGAVEIAIRKMQKTITDANSGMTETKKSFADIGLRAEDLRNLSPEKQFALIAKTITAIKDPTQKAAAAMDIFGKSGTQIIPLIADFEALQKEAKALGIVMSAKDAAAAEELNDAFGRMDALVQAIGLNISAAMTPAMMEMLESLKDTTAEINAFIVTNRSAIQSVVGWIKSSGEFAQSVNIFRQWFDTIISGAGNAGIAVDIMSGEFASAAKKIQDSISGISFDEFYKSATSTSRAMGDLFNQLFGPKVMSQSEINQKLGFPVDFDPNKVGETLDESESPERKAAREKFEKGIQDRIKKIHGDRIDDVYAKEITAIKERYEIERVQAAEVGADLTQLALAEFDEIQRADEKASRARYAEKMRLERRFRDLVIDNIDDEYAQSVARINTKYDDEVLAARGASDAVNMINQARQMELLRAQQKETARAANELEAKRKSGSDADTNRSYEISELMLEANFKGVELERKKLELAKQRALFEAAAVGASLNMVEEEYMLREQILGMQNSGFDVAGSFSAAAASAIAQGANSDATRTMKATEASAETLKKIERKIGKQAIVS